IEPWTNGKQEILDFIARDGRAIALVSTPTMIGDLFSVDEKGTFTRLTNINEKLFSELTITEPEEIRYKTFDGKTIEAWVQRPPDFEVSKKYTLILNINDSPQTVYAYQFEHTFQC